MYIYKLYNAAASKITVTGTATTLLSLIDTAGGAASSLPGYLNAVDLVIEDGDVRMLFDGNTPTATNGILLSSGMIYSFRGVPLSQMRLIRVSGNVACSVQVGKSEIGENSSAAPFDIKLEASSVVIGGVTADITKVNGATLSVSNPLFTKISDGTNAVSIIATINSLKTDLSSVAGTTTVTGGVNGLLAIAGNVAHDGSDAGYPIKIGGKAATSKPAAVSAADRVDAYFDEYGRLHVLNEGAASGMFANYISPNDGSVAYTSNVTVTCSGFPFTVDDANCTISYIQYKPTGSTWQTPFYNGVNGVSLIASSNVITIAGAGTPFASGDTYRVGIRYQDKAYTSTTDSLRVEEISPITSRYEEVSLVDTTNVAAAQQWYPSVDGRLLAGYKNMSITGKYIDGDITTSTITVYVTNDEDTTATNRDWIQIYGYDSKNNTYVNQIQNTTAGTTTFAWDFDGLNYKRVRVGLLPGDATNTAILKARFDSI